MIKTILTLTQTTPMMPAEQRDNVMNQCRAWQNEGKLTGEIDVTYDTVTKVRRVERWTWIDNNAAEAYKNLVLSCWINIYPDVNVDIVVE